MQLKPYYSKYKIVDQVPVGLVDDMGVEFFIYEMELTPNTQSNVVVKSPFIAYVVGGKTVQYNNGAVGIGNKAYWKTPRTKLIEDLSVGDVMVNEVDRGEENFMFANYPLEQEPKGWTTEINIQ